MKENNKTVITKGSGFCCLLTIAFIVLKLCNVISWSWFWVCSPLIFSFGMLLCVLVIMVTIAIIARKKNIIF